MVADLLKSLFLLLMTRLNLLKSLMLLAGVAMLAADADARMVTDGIGRQIFVPDNPLRVVALAPSITEIIFALGQEKRLAGISRFSDFPPQAMHLPRVGSYIQPDIERIISLNPDLCIAVKDGNPRAVADQMEFLHIPVYAVDPRDLESIMTMVIQIGNLLNAENRARSIVKQMASRIERVRQQVAKTAYRPKVFFQIGIAPIVSVAKGTFIDELIRIAGGINVCESYAAYPRLSREQVIALAPDVLVVTTMHRGISRDQILAEWATWTQIPAVQRGRIAIVDSDLFDRPTPRLVDALEQLIQIFHPELFQDSP